MPKRRDDYDGYYPWVEHTSPIAVADGIRAKSKQGRFATSWWADRWIRALESLMDPARLTRGRGYARRGQVMEIGVAAGLVTAKVQGSRPRPYVVHIRLKPLGPTQWDTVLDALAEQAIFAAQLLAGEMPPDIEQVFEAVHLPLFPKQTDDLETTCSCPDWANPCKHIAAVYYLLGERFDADPFLLLELRGRGKEQIAAELRTRRARVAELSEETPGVADEPRGETNVSSLEECLDHYWKMGSEAEGLLLDISLPEVECALLRRLDAQNLRELQHYKKLVNAVYGAVSARALRVAFSDS